MIRSAAEVQRWWGGMTLLEKSEFFERLLDQTKDDTQRFVLSLRAQYERGSNFSEKQLAALRKFYDNG